jgi:hypothetical protein
LWYHQSQFHCKLHHKHPQVIIVWMTLSCHG